MKIVVSPKFAKDIKKLKNHQMKRRIVDKMVGFSEVILACEDGEIPEIPNLLKLSAEDIYYRIRIGDYRLGISIEVAIDDEEDSFTYLRCLHRKDIYGAFPPE
jgi:mRNA interferase RelE/StbE